MGKKKVATILSAAALVGSLLSTSAFAAETHKTHDDNGKGSLVALGDSITFGYNLGKTNDYPSKFAFPYLIGLAEKERVTDLAVPSMTSGDLLLALNTNHSFQEAVKHADKVTIDIGSSDLLALLQATGGNVTADQINSTLGTMLSNLKAIIAKVRCLTDADIVVYDIYNPFHNDNPTDFYLHQLGTKYLPAINGGIAQTVAAFHDPKIGIADAYSAFDGNEDKYIRANDVHPTVAGQEKLAEIGLATFILEDKLADRGRDH